MSGPGNILGGYYREEEVTRSFCRRVTPGKIRQGETRVVIWIRMEMSGARILIPAVMKKNFIGMSSIPTAAIQMFGRMVKSIMEMIISLKVLT